MQIKINTKTWKGTVTIFDRLFLSQVELVENALLAQPPVENGRIRLTDIDKLKLPALIACVEKWEIANFPESVTIENFPMTPRKETFGMVDEIFKEIIKVYNGEIDIPNE